MNQENNNQNNNTSVKPQPMPATPSDIKPQNIPATPGKVEATPVNNTTDQSQVFAKAPEFKKEEVKTAPVVNPTPASNAQAPKQEATVEPTQNVVNTTKKKGGNLFLFIIIILLGIFVFKIDDVLGYFNQRFSPTPDTTVKEETSDGLVGGYLVVGDSKGFIKLKSIKFSNVRKVDGYVYIDYLSDRNYGIQNNLNLDIQLYDSNKVLIYNEDFKVNGSIESSLTRQYRILLEDEKYANVYYALVLEKNNNVGS